MLEQLKVWIAEQPDRDLAIQQVKDIAFEMSSKKHNPIENVMWVDLTKWKRITITLMRWHYKK